MRARADRAAALRGRWMAAASRRLFSPESFALLVEPAIADLQIENSGRLARRGWTPTARSGSGWGRPATTASRAARDVFVRDNELLTLTGLVLLHAAHSAWMMCSCSDSTGACMSDGFSRQFVRDPDAGCPGGRERGGAVRGARRRHVAADETRAGAWRPAIVRVVE